MPSQQPLWLAAGSWLLTQGMEAANLDEVRELAAAGGCGTAPWRPAARLSGPCFLFPNLTTALPQSKAPHLGFTDTTRFLLHFPFGSAHMLPGRRCSDSLPQKLESSARTAWKLTNPVPKRTAEMTVSLPAVATLQCTPSKLKQRRCKPKR